MLKIERNGSGYGVSASGNLKDLHQEAALLLCTLGEKFCGSESGMTFDEFLIITMLLAKKSRSDITAVDMSDFHKFLEDLNLNS